MVRLFIIIVMIVSVVIIVSIITMVMVVTIIIIIIIIVTVIISTISVVLRYHSKHSPLFSRFLLQFVLQVPGRWIAIFDPKSLPDFKLTSWKVALFQFFLGGKNGNPEAKFQSSFSAGFSLSRYVKIPQEKDLYPPGSAAYMRSEQYVVTLGSSSGQGSAFSEAK